MPAWMNDDLADRRRRGLYRRRRSASAGRELLNFASNDYLDLASDPRLARAAAGAARRYGCGAGASPLVCGHLPPHRALERALADWEGAEVALHRPLSERAVAGTLSLALRVDVQGRTTRGLRASRASGRTRP